MDIVSSPRFGDNIEAYTLFSGSKGNSVFIRCGNTSVLIDAGMSARATCRALESIGHSAAELSALFITHEHSDHIKGVEQLTRRFSMPVHAITACAPYIQCAEGCLSVHPAVYTVAGGDMEITSFVTPHDSAGSVGYIIRSDEGSVGVATDLGCMTDSVMDKLSECDAVVLESNHDVGMLLGGSYPEWLKNRVLSRTGHLSNTDCAESVCVLAGYGVKSILLAHLSAENNIPALAFRESANALEAAGLHTSLRVACASSPVRLI